MCAEGAKRSTRPLPIPSLCARRVPVPPPHGPCAPPEQGTHPDIRRLLRARGVGARSPSAAQRDTSSRTVTFRRSWEACPSAPGWYRRHFTAVGISRASAHGVPCSPLAVVSSARLKYTRTLFYGLLEQLERCELVMNAHRHSLSSITRQNTRSLALWIVSAAQLPLRSAPRL